MARKSKRSRQRDTSVIASPTLLPSHDPLVSRFHLQNINLIQDDHRRWHPLGKHRPATTVYGGPASTTLKEPQKYRPYRSMQSQTKATISFKGPSKVIECVRRKMRREVLMALKPRIGRGRRRRTWRSLIRC